MATLNSAIEIDACKVAASVVMPAMVAASSDDIAIGDWVKVDLDGCVAKCGMEDDWIGSAMSDALPGECADILISGIRYASYEY